jgi:tetratricopeptide (TPR) repeat protein
MSKGRLPTELGRVEEALVCARRAVDLNPNDPTALEGLVLAEMYAGHVQQTLNLAQRLLRVSPLDPMRWSFSQFLSIGHFFARVYALAAQVALAAVTETPTLPVGLCVPGRQLGRPG